MCNLLSFQKPKGDASRGTLARTCLALTLYGFIQHRIKNTCGQGLVSSLPSSTSVLISRSVRPVKSLRTLKKWPHILLDDSGRTIIRLRPRAGKRTAPGLWPGSRDPDPG